MKPGVGQHDDAAFGQHGEQCFFKISVPHLGVASARKGEWGDQLALLTGGDDTRPFAPFARPGRLNPLTPWGAPGFPLPPVIHPAPVEVIHVLGSQFFQLALVEPPLDFVPFAIFHEFFLAGNPVAGAAPTPRCG